MSIPAKEPVLVIGGGAAGMAAAIHLAEAGCPVVILEQEAACGGKAQHINCKQINGLCTHCGACAVFELMRKVQKHSRIECLTRYQVRSIAKGENQVEVMAWSPEGYQMLTGSRAIIAAGLKPYPAEERHETGYGAIPRVITALEMEKRARQRGNFGFLGKSPRVAIVHCIGSRQKYCSRVCCLYGAKISRLLTEALPEALITAYCLDRQHYRAEYQAQWPDQVPVITAMPGRIYQDAQGDCVLKVEDTKSGILGEHHYDWVILCTGLVPDPASVALGTAAGMSVDEYGFIDVHSAAGLVWAAGGAVAPLSFFECIESGIRAAGELLKSLHK